MKKTMVTFVLFGSLLALFLILNPVANGEVDSKRSSVEAIDEAHSAIMNKFVDKHGVILDFVGDIPTPEECALGKPNALGWFCPIENGPMFTGMYLPALCERARRSGSSIDKEQAQKLAQGLLKCASVSDVPGMIVRGMATDGKSHYPLGSDDQTHPWFLGLYVYWKSAIPSETEKREIVNKVREVATVLEANGWKGPCDGAFKGQFRGGFKGEGFRDAARYLFMLRAVYEMTGDAVWLERYKKAMTERPGKRGMSRLEICAAGYEPDIARNNWSRQNGNFFNWIYVGAHYSLRQLIEMETDAAVKEQLQIGLDASAKEALPGIADSSMFDNNDTKVFGTANWREVYTKWFPQKTQAEAMKLSGMCDYKKRGERGNYEGRFVNTPLAAAAIVAMAGDPSHRDIIEKAVRHYDYNKLYSSRFFFVVCAYYAPVSRIAPGPGVAPAKQDTAETTAVKDAVPSPAKGDLIKSASGEVLIDNNSTDVTVNGEWGSSNTSSARIGEDYLHDKNKDKGAKSVTYKAQLPGAGKYGVYLSWTGGEARASRVPVDIITKNDKKTVYVNQKATGNPWNSLGEFDFADPNVCITIRTDDTDGYIIADAVKFVPATSTAK